MVQISLALGNQMFYVVFRMILDIQEKTRKVTVCKHFSSEAIKYIQQQYKATILSLFISRHISEVTLVQHIKHDSKHVQIFLAYSLSQYLLLNHARVYGLAFVIMFVLFTLQGHHIITIIHQISYICSDTCNLPLYKISCHLDTSEARYEVFLLTQKHCSHYGSQLPKCGNESPTVQRMHQSACPAQQIQNKSITYSNEHPLPKNYTILYPQIMPS